MPELTVRLAEAPADVLEVLVEHDERVDAETVLAAVEHPHARMVEVRNALALLRDLGLATQGFDDHSRAHWTATDDGRAAIARARARGQKGGPDA